MNFKLYYAVVGLGSVGSLQEGDEWPIRTATEYD